MNAVPSVELQSLQSAWMQLLRETKLIAHGGVKNGSYITDGLHERNRQVYGILVCVLYREVSPQPFFAELTPDKRFDHLAQIVRAYISEANSSFSRRIDNFISELTWRHLQTEGHLSINNGSGSGQEVYQGGAETGFLQQLLQAYAVYITGHAFKRGDAQPCATRGVVEIPNLREALGELRENGTTRRLGGREVSLALVSAGDYFSR